MVVKFGVHDFISNVSRVDHTKMWAGLDHPPSAQRMKGQFFNIFNIFNIFSQLHLEILKDSESILIILCYENYLIAIYLVQMVNPTEPN